MKILYICHRFPYPPKRGGKIRPFNMIKHLSANHEVHIASVARSAEEREEGAGLRDYTTHQEVAVIPDLTAWLQMLVRAPSTIPSSFGYFYSRQLKSRIRHLVQKNNYDLIFVHCSSVAPYVAGVKGPRKILDFGDMDSKKWMDYAIARRWPLSWVYKLEGMKLEATERALAAQFDLATCTTRAELATLETYGTANQTGWFPNGVDPDYFHPTSDVPNSNEICFVGRMDYYPNQQAAFWFCDHVFPLLRQQHPALQFTIVGASPSADILELGERPGILVTGTVPDVRPFVTRCVLSVAPLKIARGTQNKILESMAMGVPVVASETACGGIDALPGEHVLAAASADDFCARISSLLLDSAERRRIAEAGRARILSHHDWAKSMLKLDDLINACMQEPTSERGQAVM